MHTVAHRDGEYSFIEVGELEGGFHPSDDGRNPQGSSTVAYSKTDDLEAFEPIF